MSEGNTDPHLDYFDCTMNKGNFYTFHVMNSSLLQNNGSVVQKEKKSSIVQWLASGFTLQRSRVRCTPRSSNKAILIFLLKKI